MAEAGLFLEVGPATSRAAMCLLYLQYEIIGGRQASRDMMEVGVEKNALVVHLWTLCQKLFMSRRALELGV